MFKYHNTSDRQWYETQRAKWLFIVMSTLITSITIQTYVVMFLS